MLKGPDWHVLAAASEAEALGVARIEETDLLVAEASPSVDGRSTAERLRVRVPDLPVLYVSAWHGHPDFAYLKAENVLPEPFSRDELIAAISAAVRRGAAS